MQDKIVAIVGESGSGKTTIVRKLEEQYGYNVIHSYTTREPRSKNEYGHTFGTIDDYYRHKENGVIIAETVFNNNYYWATKEQYQNKGITLYVVDPYGVDVLKKIIGDAKMTVIYLKTDENVRLQRMFPRGIESANERVKHDREKFNLIQCDWVIDNNNDIEKTVELIKNILK